MNFDFSVKFSLRHFDGKIMIVLIFNGTFFSVGGVFASCVLIALFWVFPVEICAIVAFFSLGLIILVNLPLVLPFLIYFFVFRLKPLLGLQ